MPMGAPSTPRAGGGGGVLESARLNMKMFSRTAKHTTFVEAVRIFASGKKATPAMAALIIQTNWRMHAARSRYVETQESTARVQRQYRGHVARSAYTRQRNAQRQIAAHHRGAQTRAEHGDALRRHRAAIRLQAVWRGKLARKAYRQRGGGKRTLVKRLSFRRKNKPTSSPVSASPARVSKAGAGTNPAAATPPPRVEVRLLRAASFDRKPAHRHAGAGAGARPVGSDLAPRAHGGKKELLFVTLSRNAHGLGIELDGTNTVLRLAPGGAAAAQGVLRVGDTIASVDGRSLKGVLLQQVIDPSKSTYSFDVWRWPPPASPPPAPAESRTSALRRAFSFDRVSRPKSARSKRG